MTEDEWAPLLARAASGDNGRSPRYDVAAFVRDVADYRAPPGCETEFAGFESFHQDIVADYPGLSPFLICALLGIANTPDYPGKWRVLSMILLTNDPGWAGLCERAGGAGLCSRIRTTFLTGLPIYRAFLGDPEPNTRSMAAYALGECGTPAVLSTLQDQLSRETDTQVRRYIKDALRKAGLSPDDPSLPLGPEDAPWVPSERDPNDSIPF